ncbi:MAG: response regulator [Bacteroidota bacterium]
MIYFKKLVYKIAIAILLPILTGAIILSYFLYLRISENTEKTHIDHLQDVVFSYVEFLDMTLEKISTNINKDVLFLEQTNSNTVEELLKITTDNLSIDSIIFGSGIIFDKYKYQDNRELAFFYSYKDNNKIIEVEVDDFPDKNHFDYFREKPDWWRIPADRHISGWTKPYFDSLVGHTSMVTYYQPFFFDDVFAGIVTIDISLDRMADWLKKNEKKIEKDFDPTTYLISFDSTIIYTDAFGRIGLNVFDSTNNYRQIYETDGVISVINDAIAGKTTHKIIKSIKGNKSNIAFNTPLHNTKWTAVAVIPYKIVSDKVIKTAGRAVALIFSFVIFIVIVVILMTNYITKPIIRLSQSSLKIAEGEYETEIRIKSRDEIGVLANNFKLMTTQLQKREKDINEANTKYEIIFDNSPIGILYLDDKLTIISYNKKFMEIIGSDIKDDLIGKNINVIKTSKDQKDILQDAVNTGNNKSYIAESLYNLGVFIKININPIVDSVNDNLGTIITVEDVTEQNKNTDLKIKTEAALKASESKSLFLANMSHEIRTPMNAIIGLSYLMENTELNSKQDNYLKKINSSAKMLLGIINDILDFSKIEAGKLTLEYARFNLEQMLIDVNNIFSYTAAQKGLEFILFINPDIPKEIKGDELRLKQIIINLLSNAIKFTHEGEIEVSIKVKGKTKKNIRLEFKVRDTGIGMTEEQRSKVFGAFSQADESTTRKYGGTGLGLSISKHLVEMMDGRIDLTSTPNVGTTFYFDANLVQVEQENQLQFTPTPDLEGTRVLVCDDNATARLVVSTILKSFSFKPEEFDNGTSLVEKLELPGEEKYDLLILDWQMPEIDGIEVAKRINNSNSIKHKPKVILLTAYSETNFDEMDLTGIDTVIYKPVTNSVLFDTIMNVYGKDVPKRHKQMSEVDLNTNKLNDYAGANVLLVEDNEINQEVATELLESMGLNVEIASNGKIATEKVLESNPSKFNLVFMDLQMPVMDGYTATKTIISNKDYVNLPIVAMTADVMEGVKEKCIEVGMKDFVSKPINPAEVVKAIVNWAVKPAKRATINTKQSVIKDKKEIEKEIDIPDIPGLNIESALGRMNNKKKLYLSILEKFYINNQNFISEIKATLEKGDYETSQRLIHTLKGVSGNIGADSLNEKIKLVEANIIEKDSKNTENGLNKLDVELKQLFEDISSRLDFGSKSKSKELNIELVKEIIPKLKQLLTKKSPKAKVLIKELEEAGLSGDLFNEMKNKLNKYDFKGALRLLDKLAL